MDVKDIANAIEEMEYEEVLIYSNPSYADAFLGVSLDGRAVYDYNRMVTCLVAEDNMTEEEAIEFIEYNTIGAHFSDRDPIVINLINIAKE